MTEMCRVCLEDKKDYVTARYTCSLKDRKVDKTKSIPLCEKHGKNLFNGKIYRRMSLPKAKRYTAGYEE
jgi:hypothetical protein